MKHEEFTRQIQKHKALLKKYNAVSNFVGFVKLLILLLMGSSLYLIFISGFPTGLLIVGVMNCITLIAIWKYHDGIRERIVHSNGIIVINKRHLDRMSGEQAASPDWESELFNCLYQTPSYLDADVSNNAQQILTKKDSENVARIPESKPVDRDIFVKDEAIKFITM